MNPTIRTYLRYTSWPIIAAMITLMAVGITAIHVSERADAEMTGFASKQAVFAVVGLVAFLAMTLAPYHALGRMAYLLFALTIVLLVGIFGLPSIRGSHRWIDLRLFMVQPSEIAKFGVIIMLAWYLRYGDNYRRLWGLVVPFVLTMVPMGLVLVEPDLGTGLLFPPTLLLMLYVAGARLKHLLAILAMGLVLVFVPWLLSVDAGKFQEQRQQFNTSHLGPVTFYSVRTDGASRNPPDVPVAYCRLQWKNGPIYDLQPLSLRLMMGTDQTAERARRVAAWLRPDDERLLRDKGYQPRQARLVLGAGGWSGRSDWNENDAFFRVLPDDHTDFIFCVIGGQWGLLGCFGVLALYTVIFVFGFEIATVTHDPFARLLVVGVLAMLFSQIVINAGMTMGLTPVTGMTLPLISYGGTSLVVNCAALGLLVNVGQHRPLLLSKRPFEHED